MDNKQLETAVTKTAKKVQLRTLVESLESLRTLSSESLPVFESFKISLFLKSVSPFVESFEVERNKLMIELGSPEKDKKGVETGKYTFKPKKAEEFNTKMATILDVDVKVDVPEISVSALGDVKIKPLDMTNLLWIIKA